MKRSGFLDLFHPGCTKLLPVNSIFTNNRNVNAIDKPADPKGNFIHLALSYQLRFL